MVKIRRDRISTLCIYGEETGISNKLDAMDVVAGRGQQMEVEAFSLWWGNVAVGFQGALRNAVTSSDQDTHQAKHSPTYIASSGREHLQKHN